MPVGIEMNNYDISMGTGVIQMSGGGGGLRGNVYINGNVGIGVINPTARLDVNGEIKTNSAVVSESSTANTGHIRVVASSSANYIQSGLTATSGSAAPLYFTNIYGPNTWMTITATGSVGIGTSSPAYTLDVNGSARIFSTTHPQLTIQNPAATYTGGKASIYFEVTNSTNPMGKIECVDVASNNGAFNNDMVFYSGYNVALNERMRITGTGSVGIGTVSPGATLHVAFGTNNGILHTNCVSNQTTASTLLNNTYPPSTIFGPSCTQTQLVFYSKTGDNSQLRFFLSGVAFFTGQHAVVMDKPEITQNLDDYVGLIISSNDSGCTSYYNGVKYTGIDAIRINESLPNCKLSDIDNDKAVYGVITNQKNDEYFDDSGNPMYDNTNDGWDRQLFDRVRVNSVGEGSIWITNINGNIENGDYITSSIIPGYGKKQNDDILHSYTVGKSIMSCDFSLTSTRYKTKTIEFNGQTYIAAFIGCTYHCG